MVNIILIIILFLILLVYLNFLKYNEKFLTTAEVHNELLDIGKCLNEITDPQSWNNKGTFEGSILNKVARREGDDGKLNLSICKPKILKYWEAIYLMKEICDETENQGVFSDDLRTKVLTKLFDTRQRKAADCPVSV